MSDIIREISELELSFTNKRSLFRLAVDLVKADNRIHRRELKFLDDLQRALDISQEELDLSHYTTMQQALEDLAMLDPQAKEAIIRYLAAVMKADGDIDPAEALQLSAVDLVLGNSTGRWCAVVTSIDCESEVAPDQVIYLEKRQSAEARAVFDDRYDRLMISKVLSDIGFHFFYLPAVISDIRDGGNDKFSLMKRSMEYLIPAGGREKIENLEHELDLLDVPAFSSAVFTAHSLSRDMIPFDSFLLVRLKSGSVLDDWNDSHKTVDFLCIDISEDVRPRILEFVSRLDPGSERLPYEGYYRILYDYLSSEAKTASRIKIGAEHDFCLTDIPGGVVEFESSPQSKAFYLLMLKYGNSGIGRDCFADALKRLESLSQADAHMNMRQLWTSLKMSGEKCDKLIFNLMQLYAYCSTKDSDSPRFLDYLASIIKHRSSLKNYVHNGFFSVPKLSDAEKYCIQFDKESKTYFLPASISTFIIVENGKECELTHSKLWASLI